MGDNFATGPVPITHTWYIAYVNLCCDYETFPTLGARMKTVNDFSW